MIIFNNQKWFIFMNNKYSIVAINLAYWGKNVSCLGTAETNLKHNTILQQSYYKNCLNLLDDNNQSHCA